MDDEPTSEAEISEEIEREPGLLERVVHTFRTDPITMAMSVLAVIIVIVLLLIVFAYKS
jgi:hypothetical protein